jgi:nucleotide-binding universal stress UspA family protein
MFERILVAFDGSKPAKHALDFGANLADRDGAELVLLSVVPLTPARAEYCET